MVFVGGGAPLPAPHLEENTTLCAFIEFAIIKSLQFPVFSVDRDCGGRGWGALRGYGGWGLIEATVLIVLFYENPPPLNPPPPP